jgi:hypothetical protein
MHAALREFCREHLGAPAAELLFERTSVGVVAGLALADGRRVVIKVHQPRQRREFLEAVQAVQGRLHAAGFPCPRPLLGPHPLGDVLAVAEELVDRGDYRDAHEPRVRRAMAELLVRALELAAAGERPRALGEGWNLLGGRDLWPAEPHSPIFDFQATAAGAGWIDEVAARARALIDPAGEPVVGHTDWSAKHFRFADDEVSVVYDWDSLALVPEAHVVGVAAATFTANFELGVHPAPAPDEVRAFVDDYDRARPRPLRRREREQIAAIATYVIAYTARCGHAIGVREEPGTFAAALREHGAAYLTP